MQNGGVIRCRIAGDNARNAGQGHRGQIRVESGHLFEQGDRILDPAQTEPGFREIVQNGAGSRCQRGGTRKTRLGRTRRL